MNTEIPVEKVMEKLSKQIADQAVTIATLQSYIEMLNEDSENKKVEVAE